MKKRTVNTGTVGGIFGAILIFIIGVILCFSVFGIIVGVPLILVSLLMGSKRQKVLKCNGCGMTVGR